MRGQCADSGSGQYPIPKTDGKAERCSSAIDRFHGILKMENHTTLFCSARTSLPSAARAPVPSAAPTMNFNAAGAQGRCGF
jgi:hypothetical protein